jgi:hypothetical protein
VPAALGAGIAASTDQKAADRDPATGSLVLAACAGVGTEPMSEPDLRRSPAAERMRRHRERRREGLRCVTIELRETEIEVLVQRGLLQADARNDARAVRKALYQYFDRTLN